MSPNDWRTNPRPGGRGTPLKTPDPPPPRSGAARWFYLGPGSVRPPGLAGWLIPRTVVGLAAWSLVLASVVGVIVAFVFAASQARIAERELGQGTSANQSDLDVAPPEPSPTPSASPTPDDPLSRLIGSAGRAVVVVEDFGLDGNVTAGSGFVLQATASDLWIVTSYAVVEAARRESRDVFVRLPNFARLPGTVRTVDPDRDTALVIVPGERMPGLGRFAPPVTQPGMTVYALGAAATDGRVVGVEATITQVVDGGYLIESPGLPAGSGGPVLDAEGQLLGVLPASYRPRGQEVPGSWVLPAPLLCRRVVVCPPAATASPTPSPTASPTR